MVRGVEGGSPDGGSTRYSIMYCPDSGLLIREASAASALPSLLCLPLHAPGPGC